jgi:hypothetical protein
MNAHISFGAPCGSDAGLVEIADWAGDQLTDMQRAFDAMYDSLTDMLTQEQIDEFERLHEKELALFRSA